MTDDLRTGWVIVSGGAGSLGRPIARYYAAAGRRVLVLDRADTGASQAGIEARALDATDAAAVEQTVADAIPPRDRITLLVNAVGLIWNEPVIAMRGASLKPHRIDTWRSVLDANLTAPFVVATTVALRMARAGGGAIVNFSSIAAQGNTGQAAYAAAKSGILGLTSVMAAELGPLGIRVNAIAPGFIDVPSTRAAMQPDALEALAGRTPARRLGTIDDIIRAIEFLATSPFVTGTTIDVDGGLRL